MPRFIDYDYNQTVLLPVAFENQILPGTFEHSIHYLVDNQLDLSIFDSKYKNDENGRTAYDPASSCRSVRNRPGTWPVGTDAGED